MKVLTNGISPPEYPARIAVGLLTVILALVPAVSTGNAQEPETGSYAKVCMSNPARGKPGAVVVPAIDAAALAAKGFEEVPCEQAFSGLPAQREWRNRICRFTALNPEARQEQIAQVIGERPAVLCGMAELVLGQWDQSEVSR